MNLLTDCDYLDECPISVGDTLLHLGEVSGLEVSTRMSDGKLRSWPNYATKEINYKSLFSPKLSKINPKLFSNSSNY